MSRVRRKNRYRSSIHELAWNRTTRFPKTRRTFQPSHTDGGKVVIEEKRIKDWGISIERESHSTIAPHSNPHTHMAVKIDQTLSHAFAHRHPGCVHSKVPPPSTPLMRILDPLHRTRRAGPIRQRRQRPRWVGRHMRLTPAVRRLRGWRVNARDVLRVHGGALQALNLSHHALVLVA